MVGGVHLHIFAQFNSLYLITEGKLANALELMVVPEHHFIGGPFRAPAATNQCQNITPEEHFNYTNAAIQVCIKSEARG